MAIDNDLTSLYNDYFGAPSGQQPVGNWASQAVSSASDAVAKAASAATSSNPFGGDMASWDAAQEKMFNEQQQTYREGIRAAAKAAKATLDYQYAALKAQTKDAAGRLKLDNWYKHEQVNLLKKTFDLEVEKFGLDQAKFQFQKDSFAQTQGLDILKFASGLSGPANFVQSANFAQGIAGDPQYAGFVNALTSGANSRMFGPASGQPQAQSLGGLASMFGGGTSTQGSTTADQLASSSSGGGTGYDLAARAAQAQSLISGANQLAAAGGGALGAQALEKQSPTNLALLSSGFGGAGQDFSEYLRQYNDSRVANSMGAQAA